MVAARPPPTLESAAQVKEWTVPLPKNITDNLTKALQAVTPQTPSVATNALRRLVDLGVDGYSKLPGARIAAKNQLQKSGDIDAAIERLIRQHIAMAGAQGFVTNLGGIETMALTVPANVSGIAIVQTRMVASIAHLRGYDITDERVRAAVMMCLLGEKAVNDLIAKNQLPTTPMVVATAPVRDDALHSLIGEKVLAALLSHAGGKRISVVTSKKIPVLGGGVGAVTDGWSTYAIGQYAKTQFVSRRRITSS